MLSRAPSSKDAAANGVRGFELDAVDAVDDIEVFDVGQIHRRTYDVAKIESLLLQNVTNMQLA
jgi:hypothetical protein